MKKGLLPYRCLIHPEQIITGTCPICKEDKLDTQLNSILNNKSNNPVVCDKHPDVILHIKWDDGIAIRFSESLRRHFRIY